MIPDENSFLNDMDADVELGNSISQFLDDAGTTGEDSPPDETLIPEIDPQVEPDGSLDTTQPTLILDDSDPVEETQY